MCHPGDTARPRATACPGPWIGRRGLLDDPLDSYVAALARYRVLMSKKKRGEKLTVPQVAERLQITPAAWRAYVSRARKAHTEGRVTPSMAPLPDGQYDERTPWWWESTIDEWNASRRGRGWRAGVRK